MGETIRVGIADLKVTKSPNILITLGLGSCVGIGLHDPISRVTGLAHIMLPDSTQARAAENQAKFADTAVIVIIKKMLELGANRNSIVAKIIGGAQMFTFVNADDRMRIGERNTEAVKKALAAENIPILAEETGGKIGRTMEIHALDGKVTIRTIGQGERTL